MPRPCRPREGGFDRRSAAVALPAVPACARAEGLPPVFDVVFRHRKKPDEDVRRIAQQVIGSEFHAEKYGPISDLSQVDLSADLAGIIERRHSPLYRLLEDQ